MPSQWPVVSYNIAVVVTVLTCYVLTCFALYSCWTWWSERNYMVLCCTELFAWMLSTSPCPWESLWQHFNLGVTAEMMHFAGDEPVVLSLVSSFADAYRPDAVTLDLPKPLGELYHVNNTKLSYADLLTMCASVMPTLTVTAVQVCTTLRVSSLFCLFF